MVGRLLEFFPSFQDKDKFFEKLTGDQHSCNLRPFIGHRGMAFEIFREQEGNFYKALFDILTSPFADEDKKESADTADTELEL